MNKLNLVLIPILQGQYVMIKTRLILLSLAQAPLILLSKGKYNEC